MLFEIHAEKNANDKAIFYYDNETNTLTNQNGDVFQYPDLSAVENPNLVPFKSFDREHPLKKSKQIQLLKIKLGLSCNYSCDYCSQKFVERMPETTKKDIDAFMEKLNVLEFSEEKGLKVEFWGGEPLVYWKTLKPLVDAMNDKFADWKNKFFQYCTGDYIFQIDADEIPHQTLIELLPEVLEKNDFDICLVPRVNIVEGITQEHIQKWGWNVLA